MRENSNTFANTNEDNSSNLLQQKSSSNTSIEQDPNSQNQVYVFNEDWNKQNQLNNINPITNSPSNKTDFYSISNPQALIRDLHKDFIHAENCQSNCFGIVDYFGLIENKNQFSQQQKQFLNQWVKDNSNSLPCQFSELCKQIIKNDFSGLAAQINLKKDQQSPSQIAKIPKQINLPQIVNNNEEERLEDQIQLDLEQKNKKLSDSQIDLKKDQQSPSQSANIPESIYLPQIVNNNEEERQEDQIQLDLEQKNIELSDSNNILSKEIFTEIEKLLSPKMLIAEQFQTKSGLDTQIGQNKEEENVKNLLKDLNYYNWIENKDTIDNILKQLLNLSGAPCKQSDENITSTNISDDRYQLTDKIKNIPQQINSLLQQLSEEIENSQEISISEKDVIQEQLEDNLKEILKSNYGDNFFKLKKTRQNKNLYSSNKKKLNSINSLSLDSNASNKKIKKI